MESQGISNNWVMTIQDALMFIVRHRLVITFRDLKRGRMEIPDNPLEYKSGEEVIGVEMLIYKRNDKGENIFGVSNPIGLELSQDPALFPQVFIRYLLVFRAKWKEQFGTELE